MMRSRGLRCSTAVLAGLLVRGSALVAHPGCLRTQVRCEVSRAARTRGGINIRAEEDAAAPTHSTLSELPDLGSTGRLVKAAYRASKEVKPNMKIGNMKKRATKLAASRIDAYTSSISVSLREKQRTFNDLMRRLLPFEAELAELTLRALEKSGGRSLKGVVDDFDAMRRAVVRVGKEASAKASAAEHKRESLALVEEGIELVETTLEAEAGALHELNRVIGMLRRLPRVAQARRLCRMRVR